MAKQLLWLARLDEHAPRRPWTCNSTPWHEKRIIAHEANACRRPSERKRIGAVDRRANIVLAERPVSEAAARSPRSLKAGIPHGGNASINRPCRPLCVARDMQAGA
jgi:hypothetical protein